MQPLINLTLDMFSCTQREEVSRVRKNTQSLETWDSMGVRSLSVL